MTDMRTEAEIRDAIIKADAAMNTGRIQTGRMIAQGVGDALRWVLGEETNFNIAETIIAAEPPTRTKPDPVTGITVPVNPDGTTDWPTFARELGDSPSGNPLDA